MLLLAAALAAPSGLLMSPADLAAQLADPAVVVVHIEDRGGDFANGHVPGARLVRYDQIAVDGADQLGSELPPVDALREVFHAVGVGAGSKVVVYGSAIGATRAFFTLDYLGHPNVRVLNGGLGAWRVAGQKVELGPPAAAAPRRREHAGPADAAARRRRPRRLAGQAARVAANRAGRRPARCRVHRRRRRHGRHAPGRASGRGAAAGVDRSREPIVAVPARCRAARQARGRRGPQRRAGGDATAWSACAPRSSTSWPGTSASTRRCTTARSWIGATASCRCAADVPEDRRRCRRNHSTCCRARWTC